MVLARRREGVVWFSAAARAFWGMTRFNLVLSLCLSTLTACATQTDGLSLEQSDRDHVVGTLTRDGADVRFDRP